jgi:threonine dehydratase
MINRYDIAQAERLIRPHIRRSPVVEVDAADFGLAAARLSFKLELFQHAGSFKTRGAFTNLLTRNIPRAGIADSVVREAETFGVRALSFGPSRWPSVRDVMLSHSRVA